MTLTFTFHHIVRLRVETDDPACAEFFQAEYRPYLNPDGAGDTALPLVSLTFRRGTPRGASFPHAVRHTHKVLARWAYRVELSDDEVRIQAQGNRWAIPMIHHMLVHPSLRLLAARRGVLMLHAGAVAYGDRSVVLTGTGGVGKTTTTSLLLNQDDPRWALHADDYVFLSPQGDSYSYLTRSHLYRPLLDWVPSLGDRLTPGERLRLRLLWWVRSWSGDRLKWPVRVEAARLWPQRRHQPRARLAAMVWLQRAAGERATLTAMRPTAEQVEQLLTVNFHEARHYLALLRAQPDFDPQVVAAWREQERALLRALAEGFPWYRLDIPTRRRDTGFLDALAGLLREGT